MDGFEMSLTPTPPPSRKVAAPKPKGLWASYITGTSADTARMRGEEILGLPVLVNKEWSITATITPAQAKLILVAQPGQRTLYPNEILKYKRHILRGTFKKTHQGIAFDTDGFLYDGQHRLHGCVEADMPIEVQCNFNGDRALFDCLDRGRPRSLTDDLITTAKVTGHRESAMVAAGARILDCLDRGIVPWTHFARGEFDVHDVGLAMQNHPHLLEAAQFCARNSGKLSGIGTGVCTGFLARFMEINREKALSFFEEIMTGELLVSGDPAYEMREYMRGGKVNAVKARPNTMTALVRCWNAYVEGRKLDKLYTRPRPGGALFPEISKGK